MRSGSAWGFVQQLDTTIAFPTRETTLLVFTVFDAKLLQMLDFAGTTHLQQSLPRLL